MESLEVVAIPTATVGQRLLLAVPDVLSVVRTGTLGHELTFPDHDSAAEIAHFFAILVKTLGLYSNHATIIL